MKAYQVIWLALLFAVNDSYGQKVFSGMPLINNYPSKTYNAGTQNWNISQDKRNVMYFANSKGLLEFDGSEWRLYKTSGTSILKSVAIQNDGKILVGGQNLFGYFSPDEKGKLKYHSLKGLIPGGFDEFDEVWDIYTTEKEVYFCSHKAIFIYAGGKITLIKPKKEILYSYLLNNTLYVSGWEEGLLELKENQLVPVPGGEVFKNKRIKAFIPFRKESALIATLGGELFQFRDNQFYPWKIEGSEFFHKSLITTMIRLHDGSIAIGTQNDGLMIYDADGKRTMHLGEKSLNSKTLLSLYQDRFNNLWIGLNNGLHYFEVGSPFSIVDSQVGISGAGYAAYSDNNSLYLGTVNGLFFRNNDPIVPTKPSFELVKNTAGQVYSVEKVDEEILLGHHQGPFRIEQDKASQIANIQGAWMFQPLINRSDYMLQGHYVGLLLYKKENGKWKFLRKLKGFSESSRLFEQDDRGYIWMSHGFKGVYRLKINESLDSIAETKFFGEKDGLPSNLLINLYKIKGKIVFCADKGIYEYDEKSNRFIRERRIGKYFSKDSRIWALEEDQFGNIYFIENNELGILKYDKSGDYKKQVQPFEKVNHLISDDLQNIAVIDEENVFIGAKDGFVHYRPSVPKRLSKEFHILMREVDVQSYTDSVIFEGTALSQSGVANNLPDDYEIVLPYSHNAIRFAYAAPYFDGSKQVDYQSYLEGFEQDWSGWSKKTERLYTNLAEGEYVFHIRAKNAYGNISKEEICRVIVLPPWYRSDLAYFGYGCGVLLLLYIGVRILNKKHKKETKMMKQEIEQKKDEIINISEASEKEIQRLKEERLEVEIAHKNQELMVTTMHIVNKNEYLISIKKKLKKLVNDLSDDGASRELNRIINSVDRNIADEKEWNQFEEHFDLIHGDFFKKIKRSYPMLSLQEIKLCAYIKIEMTTKEIAQLLNLSVRGVETCRYRLRRKLDLDKDYNLVDFINSI